MSNITAVVLCGGKGERLRPFTHKMPKALVPIKGRPLLYHLLHYLHRNGIKRSVLCTGYKAEAIEEFVEDNRERGWRVTCVNSGDASMTDRILDARRAADGPFLICYGDTLSNVDIAALRQAHEQSGALATMTVYPLRSQFGVVRFEDCGRVRAFEEKPSLPYWINIGFILCEAEVIKYIKRGADMPDFLSALAEANALFAHQHNGKHVTVNTERDRTEAETEMIEFFTLIDGQDL